MMPRAYYNEIDPFAAQWLRNLMAAGHIMEGDVDDRSIVEVRGKDLEGYTRCHFFAGIGGWDYALRLAGWAGPVWTGSCPCQPFSCAGKRQGEKDARHLWPEFYRLVRECRPPVVFGEQVASKDGLGWLDGVFTDLEGAGYACGASDLCAAGVGAPHIRQRLYWVAQSAERGRLSGLGNHDAGQSDTEGGCGCVGLAHAGCQRGGSWGGPWRGMDEAKRSESSIYPEPHSESGGLGQPHGAGLQPGRIASETDGHGRAIEPASGIDRLADAHECQRGQEWAENGGETGRDAERTGGDAEDCGLEHPAIDGRQQGRAEPDGGSVAGGCGVGRLGDGECEGLEGRQGKRRDLQCQEQAPERTSPAASAWSDCILIPCRDNKVRRISSQSGDVPLVAGIPRDVGRMFPGLAGMAKPARRNRVGRLKGYGNAIVPEVAAEFVRACKEA